MISLPAIELKAGLFAAHVVRFAGNGMGVPAVKSVSQVIGGEWKPVEHRVELIGYQPRLGVLAAEVVIEVDDPQAYAVVQPAIAITPNTSAEQANA